MKTRKASVSYASLYSGVLSGSAIYAVLKRMEPAGAIFLERSDLAERTDVRLCTPDPELLEIQCAFHKPGGTRH